MKSVLQERQKKIIELLIRNGTTVQSSIIANALNVTSRTIRNDIKSINGLINAELIVSNQNGYIIDSNLLPVLNMETSYMDDDKLHKQLLKELLLKNQNLNIEDLSDTFYMSTSTLNKHLKEISKELESNNLKLKKKDGLILVDGSELDKRKMINKLIFSDVNSNFFSLENCANFFDNIDILKIKQIVLDSLNKYHLYANDIYSTNLVINIGTTLSRIIDNFSIDSLPVKNYNIIDTVEFRAAKCIVNEFYNIYNKVVKANDIIYISLLIMGQTKKNNTDALDYNVKNLLSNAFLNKIREIVKETFDYFMLDINFEDLLWNFALHINFLIIRSSVGNSVANSLIDNIKSNCPFIYDVAVYLSNRIAETFSITVNDYEIGFIALYTGVAIETSSKSNNKIKAILICNDYYNLSNKLSEKIKERYSNSIDLINITPNINTKDAYSDSVLFISTLPDTALINNMVTISPFLSSNDIMKLDKAINLCLKEKRNKLAKQLLFTCFHEELFFHNLKFKNKYEIIKFLGNKTAEFGIAGKDFTSSVIKRENLSSTCFLNSFAVPHAIELNANKTTFCILTSEEPFAWDNNNIKVVFMIAVSKKDRKEFEEIYNSIVDILCDDKCISKISQAKTFTNFINYINEML